MLWVDKHRPLELGKMSYHGELSERLATLAADGDIPHLLFYGPSGAGKKTLMALLRALYGAGAEQRLEHRDFKTPTNKAIEVATVASNYHIEINPCWTTSRRASASTCRQRSQRIAKASKRNLRRAILSLECKVQQYPFDAAQAVPLPDWEQYVVAIASDIGASSRPSGCSLTRQTL
ncbi:hypothetical protein JL720_13803 [Aureococcus anophagefferens]|nr:hypothetical protein JL720_13803 [Aureococcus anophagefferens]